MNSKLTSNTPVENKSFITYLKKLSIKALIAKQSIKTVISVSMILFAFLLIFFVGYNWATYELKKLNHQFETTNNKYINYQKEIITNQVNRTLDYIDYIRSLSRNNMKQSLKGRVDVSWNIAMNIYKENKGSKSDDEIKKMIKDALRSYKNYPSRNCTFIYTTDGVTVLQPNHPETEGKSGMMLHDKLGNYMVQRETKLLKDVDRGYIEYYNPSHSGENDPTLYRYTYIRKFEPFGWYLGSKEYLTDFEEKIKNEVLGYVSSIRFDNNGYIFIHDTESRPILTNHSKQSGSEKIPDSLNKKSLEKITKTALDGGGFVDYTFHRPGVDEKEAKISYVQLIKGWDWVIGAGFYSSDIEKASKLEKEELRSKRTEIEIRIALSLFIILLLSMLITRWAVKRINKGFDRFDRFFKEASYNYTPIEENELFYPEFISLARSANKMINDVEETRSALMKEQSLLISLINSIPDLVFFKDLDTRYLSCNTAFAKYLGIQTEEIVGKSDLDFYPKEIANAFIQNDKKILNDRIPLRNEDWIKMPDGEERLFDTFKVLCYDSNGEIMGILGISRDITEKEIIKQKYFIAKEKAEESDRLKTSFLANMSHEIRTPMNSIVGFSNLIIEGGLTNEEQYEYVGHINNAVDNLLNLINDIIDISKIEAGQLTVKPEYFNLDKLMSEVYVANMEYRKKFVSNHVSLYLDIDKSLGQTKILADPFRLNQVLTNLLVNATKFTKEGEIVFGYRVIDEQLQFFVRDTGIGISKEDQAIIFTRFRQAEGSKNYRTGGTGLGLAISKHIVSLMQGVIWVESEKGVGSTFYFNLPYFPLINDDNKKNGQNEYNWKDKTIMVVENEDASFQYLTAVFCNTGIKLVRAHSGAEALEMFKNMDKLDLIYNSINLEDDSFYRFVSDVKVEKPDVPVIGQRNFKENDENYPDVFDKVITKPVNYHLLMQVIAPFINQ